MRRSIAGIVLLVVAGCGGGGGGGGSASGSTTPPRPSNVGYTLSTNSITQEATITDQAPYSEVRVTIGDATVRPLGVGGRFTDNGLNEVYYNDDAGVVELYFRVPGSLRPGTYSDYVIIGSCTNADDCREVDPQSASRINVTYTVLEVPLPTVTMSTAEVNVTALAGGLYPPAPVEIMATVPYPIPFGGHGSSSTKNGIELAGYSGVSATSGKFTVEFKSPYELPVGTHTDTISVRMCLHETCANELTVTPATINVTYTVTDTVDGPNGFKFQLTDARARDLAWDETRNLLYLAVPSDAPERAATITEFDPSTGAFGDSISAGVDPGLLSLSDDDAMLYVADASDDSIRRFTTGPLTPDITIFLGEDDPTPVGGPLVASDLKVAPGAPRLIAVRRINPKITGTRGLILYEDDVPRANIAFLDSDVGHIQWGADATLLYTNNRAVAVDADGLTPLYSYPSVSGRFDRIGDRIFSEWGEVTDVVAGTSLPSLERLGFPAPAATVDPVADRVYLLTRPPEASGIQIEVYDATSLERLATGQLPFYAADANTPAKVVRWGRDGLAIATESGRVILVSGPLIVP